MANKRLLKDAVEWDTINWSKALAFWDEKVNLQEKDYQCLELGGRRGGLSLWLALKGNNVICSDLENPEVEAKRLHEAYGVNNRISYQAIDATRIPFENHFDLIVFKSILGGISRDGQGHLNQVVIDQIHNALKPGGTLLFAENLSASPLHSFFRKKLVRWGGSWNYLEIQELPTLMKRFSRFEYGTAGFLGAFGRSELQRNLFGYIDSLIFDWSLASRLKYIVFGTASK